MKKFLAILLSVMLVLSLSVFAFAGGDDPALGGGGSDSGSTSTVNDSITVNSAKEGETYNIYKLFNLVVDNESSPSAYSYTINPTWAAFFADAVAADPNAEPPVEAVAAGPGNQYITKNAAGYVTGISDPAALAKAAASYAAANSIAYDDTETCASGDTSVTFSGLDNGYWLVTSTLGTAAMTETTPDASAVTINEKNPLDTVQKQVKEDSTSQFGTSNDAQIGDTVEYQSTVTLLPNTRNVVYHDTMDSGLTFTGTSSVTVTVGGTALDSSYYTVAAPGADGETFTVTFTQAYLDTLSASTAVVIAYTATLNAGCISATPEIDSQTNTAMVSFGDDQSVDSTTTTTTHKFAVNKYATGINDLAGAVFSLKKAGTVVPLIKIDDNNYRVALTGEANTTNTFISVASGDVVIWGVDADSDYSLEEITPPDGYNALTSDVSVTVDAANSTVVDVENSTGTELPSTGGIGTTIFYIVGAILVLGAGILIVAKRRSAAAEQ